MPHLTLTQRPAPPPYTRDSTEEKSEHGPSVLVHPDEAVRRLKAFVEVYGTGPSRGGGGGAISGPLRMQGMLRRAAEREQVRTVMEQAFLACNTVQS